MSAIPRCPHCHQQLYYNDQPSQLSIRPSLHASEQTTGVLKHLQREPIFIDGQHKSLHGVSTRHVHFDIPGRTKKHHTSRHSEAYLDGTTARQDHHHHHTPPPPHPLRSILTPPPPPPPPPLDTSLSPHPTIYILTYSTDLTRTSTSFTHLLSTQLPHRVPPIPHLYTIDARTMTPPSAHLCARYSGLAPIIQDAVLEDRAARKAVKQAVRDLLEFGARERRKGSGIKREREKRSEVAISVCCHAGTHRSVAIAERVAQEVKREVGALGVEEGVRVVCRHVHRVRGRGDPY